ncbi:SRPBCC family protein [Hydrocarboniclastica marina]|uniref:Polyketide cyclase n=1 Tax=Hydrocarboniclastica marina TaxID=2259620 RepID=A0A4P7XEB2_9ALTE|nr:SRPBCC family protein [Hydrocarboniclastica marina]QCF25231.1 polyketide cyclase [Hydrocarboniclastica marina]
MSEREGWGTLRKVPGGYEARLKRLIDHDRHRVWSMLTCSELLCQWLAPGSVEPVLGGRVRIDFAASGSTIDSTVSAIDVPSVLEYSWSSGNEPVRPVRWELAGNDECTELKLILRLPENDDPARACAGWDTHLEMLLAAMEGVSISFPVQRYRKAREAFAALAST